MRVEMYATLYLYLLCIHAAIEHLYRIESNHEETISSWRCFGSLVDDTVTEKKITRRHHVLWTNILTIKIKL